MLWMGLLLYSRLLLLLHRWWWMSWNCTITRLLGIFDTAAWSLVRVNWFLWMRSWGVVAMMMTSFRWSASVWMGITTRRRSLARTTWTWTGSNWTRQFVSSLVMRSGYTITYFQSFPFQQKYVRKLNSFHQVQYWIKVLAKKSGQTSAQKSEAISIAIDF